MISIKSMQASFVAVVALSAALSFSSAALADSASNGKLLVIETTDPTLILERAEDLRNPSTAYSTKVTVVDESGGKKETRTFETLVKGRDKSLVKFLTPSLDRGTQLLFVDVDMWLKAPKAAKATQVSPAESLLGVATYSDVARLNFIGNYAAKLDREAKLDGEPAWVLEMKAVPGRPVTFDHVEYWVAKAGFRPLKAVYMTDGGEVVRVATFSDFRRVLDGTRPTKMRLVAGAASERVTTVTFRNAKAAKISDVQFEKQHLGR